MCLIITQPKGHTLSRDHVRDIATRNPHGFGIMYAHGGVLHTMRAVGTIDDMVGMYYQHAAGVECVVHFRQATHGAINADNAHPYHITDDIAVMHNGIIDVGTPITHMSDTWHVCHFLLAPIARDNADALFTDDMGDVLGGLIGNGSKLVIQHADGRRAIINEHMGVSHMGRWYSNTYAWNAPASLRPQVSSRGWYGGGWGESAAREYAPAASTPSMPSTAMSMNRFNDDDIDVIDDGDDIDVMDDTIAELIDAHDIDGEHGVYQWVKHNRRAAAAVLLEWYNIDADDVDEYITTDDGAVASHLIADILPELITSTRG